MKTIGYCSCGNLWENPDTGLCSSCAHLQRKAERVKPAKNNTAIKKESEKQSKWNNRYLAKLKGWKRGKKCAATFPHDCSDIITCHHMFSRSVNEYHDEWAMENEIPYLMDDRLWMPLCVNAHQYITDHSKFAWENGYSFKRISDPIFRTSVNS
jgi:hypothetical protein